MTNGQYSTINSSLEYQLFRIFHNNTVYKKNSSSYVKMETKMTHGQNLYLWIFYGRISSSVDPVDNKS